jgi:hypothetical protein
MDPLQKFLHLATERGVMHHITPRLKGIKTFLYADNAAIFVSPRKQDLATLKEILDFFLVDLGASHKPPENRNFSNQL